MKDTIISLLTKNFFKFFTAFALIISFLYILSPFFVPIILGSILAMALSPFVKKFMDRGMSRKKAINMLTLIIFIIGLVPSILFSIRGATVVAELFNNQGSIDKLKALKENAMNFLDSHAATLGLSTDEIHVYLEQILQNVGKFFLDLFSNFLSQIPDLILVSLITFIAIYFFLFEEEKIRSLFDRYFYFSNDRADRFIKVLKSSCREVFFSNVLTGIIQSFIVTIGALIFGVGDFFIIFFITFICSFIPVLGAGPVAFVLSLIAFGQGHIVAGIGMFVISVVSGLADNIIRPYLASMGEVEVNGFISFLAVIGGVIVLGLPGLFVGPLLASLVFGVLPIIIEEYFPPKNSEHETSSETI